MDYHELGMCRKFATFWNIDNKIAYAMIEKEKEEIKYLCDCE